MKSRTASIVFGKVRFLEIHSEKLKIESKKRFFSDFEYFQIFHLFLDNGNHSG